MKLGKTNGLLGDWPVLTGNWTKKMGEKSNRQGVVYFFRVCNLP